MRLEKGVYETLQVVYLDGHAEMFEDAESAQLYGQGGQCLEVRRGDRSQLACIPLTSMRKWGWVRS